MRRLRRLLAGVLVITLLVGMLPGCQPPGQEQDTLQDAEDMSACRLMRLVAARIPHYDWSLRFLGATDTEIAQIVQLTKDLSVQVCAGPVKPYWTYKEGQKLDEALQEVTTRLAGHLGVSLAEAIDISFLVFSSQTEARDRNCGVPGFDEMLSLSETQFESLLEDEQAGECNGQAIGARGDTEWEWADAKADMSLAQEWMDGCMDDFMNSRFTGDICSNPLAEEGDIIVIGPDGEDWTKDVEDMADEEDQSSDDQESGDDNTNTGNEATDSRNDIASTEDDETTRKNNQVADGELWMAVGGMEMAVGAMIVALASTGIGTAAGVIVFLVGLAEAGHGALEKHEGQTKDCLVYQPTEDIASPFLVDRLGGLDGFENQLFPPTMADAFQHCMCEVSRFTVERSQLNLFNDMGCPSEEDQERLDCLMNPWGPDDGPRLDCLALLDQDSELLKQNCSEPVYCLDGLLAYSADGENCGCVPHQALIMTLPSSACETMDCPEGTRCVCETAASCSCGGYVEDHDEIIFNNGFYDPFENIVIAPPIPRPVTELDPPREP